jgi:Uma2 family endonuclease
MEAALHIPSVMTLEEFLAWDAPAGTPWQQLDGKPQPMAPASRTHGRIQCRLNSLIDVHLSARGGPCTPVPNADVLPQVRSENNFRIPNFSVTRSPYHDEEPSCAGRDSVAQQPSGDLIPSVQEILIVHSAAIHTEWLRRDAVGNWPEQALAIDEGVLEPRSIGLIVERPALYRGTRMAPSYNEG